MRRHSRRQRLVEFGATITLRQQIQRRAPRHMTGIERNRDSKVVWIDLDRTPRQAVSQVQLPQRPEWLEFMRQGCGPEREEKQYR
jgi:hypothetical protein